MQPIDALSINRIGIYDKVASGASKAVRWTPLMIVFLIFHFVDPSPGVFFCVAILSIAYANFFLVDLNQLATNILA
jgi:hypothetical protein